MKSVTVVGAGNIGSVIADMLAATGDYEVVLVDADARRLETAQVGPSVSRLTMDVSDPAALGKKLEGRYAVISAAPFRLTTAIAEAAFNADVHYLDLTEDVASTRTVRELAERAKRAFIPQCGLAPGFITIVTADMIRRFDSLRDVRMRVGALPEHPSNALNYNMTWSTEGVINEYCEPCEAIVDGRRRETPALEEVEAFSIDGVRYEAFNTSGGLGSLCETLDGKVQTLNYRTIRYPGHAAIMKTLLNDLRLRHKREIFKQILEDAIPATTQDVVVIFVTVSGMRNGALVQDTYVNKVYAARISGQLRTAIQITTCSAACAVLDLLAQEQLAAAGFVRQEEIPLDLFLANRFGRNYGAGLSRAPVTV